MVRQKRPAWIVLLGLVALIIYGNCYKIKLPEPKNIKLPEATMKGKNTFGCLVNGENFKNKNYWQVILVIPTKIKGLSSSYNNTSYDNFAAHSISNERRDDLHWHSEKHKSLPERNRAILNKKIIYDNRQGKQCQFL